MFWFKNIPELQNTKVLNMSGLYKVLNKYFMIDVWQYSEYALDSDYARLLSMPGLYMVLNKFAIMDIWQGSE